MKYFSTVLALLLLSCSSTEMLYQFSTNDYSAINPDLLENAYSTVRESNIELVVHSASLATYTERVAITIHNEEHSDLSNIVVSYDNLSEVEYLNARVIDRNGQVLQTYSMADAGDFSQYDGVSFLSDNRVKVIQAYSNSYPYTIEYEYQRTLYSTLNLPGWYPMLPDQSIESSSFSVSDYRTGVRTHPVNFEPDRYDNETVNGTVSVWNLANQMAIETEPYSSIIDNVPYMLVSPGVFKVGESIGDASNWKNFGKWYYDLGAETRELPEAAKSEIDALVSGVTDQEEIVAILFNYLQEKNRYVSIQLGIGGWKPFSAQYVFDNSYGDCKALTNYMQAALEYVGIKADAVLINATSSRPLIEEFSGNQFNHVVLRVVLENGEEIWLECTSKYLPPNNLGDGYSKKALLVTENGGEIVDTPEKKYSDNAQKIVYTLNIDQEGNAMLDGNISFSGANQSGVLHNVLSVSDSDKIEWLDDQLESGVHKINEADFTGVNSASEISSITFQATLDNYANSSSKRLFIPINRLNRWKFNIEDSKNRKLPIQFNYSFTEYDSVTFKVPIGYEIESLPKSSDIMLEFAEYYSEVNKVDDQTYVFNRELKMKEREISAESYSELRNFLNDVRRSDQQQLVLVRNN